MASIAVQCTNCQARLKLKNPKVLGRKIACPKCHKPFVAVELGAEEEQDEFDFDFESEPQESSSQVSSRKKRPAAKRSSARRPAANRLREISWLWVGVAGGGLLLLVAALFVIPWGSVANVIDRVNPLSDTPEGILAELEGLKRDYSADLKSLKTGEPSQQLAERFNRGISEAEDLFVRAAGLDLIPSERFKEMGKKHPELVRFGNRVDSIDSWLKQNRATAAAGQDLELWMSASQFNFTCSNVMRVIANSQAPPEPQNESQKIEADRIRLLLNLLKKLSRINSAAEMKSAAAGIEEDYYDRLQQLNEDLSRSSKQPKAMLAMSGGPYESVRQHLLWRIGQVGSTLNQRYGNVPEFKGALERFDYPRDFDP